MEQSKEKKNRKSSKTETLIPQKHTKIIKTAKASPSAITEKEETAENPTIKKLQK